MNRFTMDVGELESVRATLTTSADDLVTAVIALRECDPVFAREGWVGLVDDTDNWVVSFAATALQIGGASNRALNADADTSAALDRLL